MTTDPMAKFQADLMEVQRLGKSIVDDLREEDPEFDAEMAHIETLPVEDRLLAILDLVEKEMGEDGDDETLAPLRDVRRLEHQIKERRAARQEG